jgi:hypothetical protein
MYGKVFQGIHKSTLMAVGGWLPTYIFEQMIVIADKDGIVEHAPLALYREIGLAYETEFCPVVPLSRFEKAIQYLESPDPDSKSPTLDGRRIVPLKDIPDFEENRGWLIVNYEHYRVKGSKVEQRGASTKRVQEFRKRQKESEQRGEHPGEHVHEQQKNGLQENQQLNLGCNGNVTDETVHIDTDTDIDNKTLGQNPFDRFWKVYPNKKQKQRAIKAFDKIDPSLYERIIADVDERAQFDEQWLKESGRFIPHPASYLNGGCWEDEWTRFVPQQSSEPQSPSRRAF